MEEVGVVLGGIPSWLSLGPAVLRDGVSVRPVLGDWSHRQECDRPPAFLIEGAGKPLPRQGPLLPIPQRLPGKSIALLKGKRSGSVAVLFNGPSLADHDLWKIKFPIIGMNRTFVGNPNYKGPQPDYLCAIDDVWFRNKHVLSHPRLVNGGINPMKDCYRATRDYRGRPFSFDLKRDGYVPLTPGTTGFLALQLAVWLGFTDLYCLGLDLGGAHFDGSSGVSQHFAWMNRYFKGIAPVLKDRGIRVTICGSPKSTCTAFDHSEFSEVAA